MKSYDDQQRCRAEMVSRQKREYVEALQHELEKARMHCGAAMMQIRSLGDGQTQRLIGEMDAAMRGIQRVPQWAATL